MGTLRSAVRNFLHQDEGVVLSEYAMLLSLIAVSLLGLIVALRLAISGRFRSAAEQLQRG